MTPLIDRLQKKLKVMPNGCWEFQGQCDNRVDKGGYGKIRKKLLDGTWVYVRVHREMYEIVFDLIPEGLQVLHKCDNPPCCNPKHLWLGTHDDNHADKQTKGRGTHGEKHWNAKLDWKSITEIKNDSRFCHEIADTYGVSESTISRIKRGDGWKEIL